jgi:hypothetical protein
MLFATQKAYFRRQRQRGGERFDVDSLADISLDSFSYGCGCRCHRECSHRKASGFYSFPILGRAASSAGPNRHGWPRSNVHLRVQAKYSATIQLRVDRNASKT